MRFSSFQYIKDDLFVRGRKSFQKMFTEEKVFGYNPGVDWWGVWGSSPMKMLKIRALYLHFPDIWGIISVDLKAVERGNVVLSFHSFTVDNYDFPQPVSLWLYLRHNFQNF